MKMVQKLYYLVCMLWTTVLLSIILGEKSFILRQFKQETICHIEKKLDTGCLEKQAGIFASILDCARFCDSNCYGVVMQGNNSCYFSRKCDETFSCSTGDVEFTLYARINLCQHDSEWNMETDACKCVDGWVGERCERLPKSCAELRLYGYVTKTPLELWVKLDLDTYPVPVSVRCDIYIKYENIAVMRSEGEFNNNRSFTEYLMGFYHDESNFWIGLDTIKALNDAGYSRLGLQAGFNDQDGNFSLFRRAFYNFKISDASSGFTFTFSDTTTSGHGAWNKKLTYGDCLTPVEGAKFLTWDHDVDEVPSENCAALAGVGWWFKDCNMTCNPLGWSYQTRPISSPESMTHVKMDGIDYASETYAKTSQTRMILR